MWKDERYKCDKTSILHSPKDTCGEDTSKPKSNLNVLKVGYYPFKVRNIFRNIKRFFINIKYAYDRITKGYCDWDVYDLDYFYTDLLANTLYEFANNT